MARPAPIFACCVVVVILCGCATGGVNRGGSRRIPRQAGPFRVGVVEVTEGVFPVDVYTVRSDGSGLRRLTRGHRFGGGAWSADGRWIAVTYYDTLGGAHVRVLASDGSGPARPLTSHEPRGASAADDSPAWSPDSRRIVLVRGDRVDVVDLPSGREHSLGAGGLPAWSPTGREIAYWSDRGLMLASVDGRKRRLLDHAHVGFSAPSWSPDGGSLVYETAADDGRVYVIGRDGAGRRGLGLGRAPAWSPTGAEIAYQCGHVELDQICVIRPNGEGPWVIGHGVTNSSPPSWSPDGTRIAYTSADTLGARVVRADGTNDHRIAKNGWVALSWRPT